MNSDGVTILDFGEVTQVILETLSGTLKDEIEENLTAYCHGATEALDDPAALTFERTLKQFFALYDEKPANLRVGLAGELLVHILFSRTVPHLMSTCVYFNKEENQVKKGFDLTLVDRSTDALWYGEVKSGELGTLTSADEKAKERLDVAARGLHAMFNKDISEKRWLAAKIDAGLTLERSKAVMVKQLLGQDLQTATALAGTSGSVKPNALLVAIVMHDHTVSSLTGAESSVAKISKTLRSGFNEIKILLIQQDEVETIVDFLRDKAK